VRVFWGVVFLGGCTQKNPPGFFWVCTRVSEPCQDLRSHFCVNQTS